jgi:hypothetical protein
MCIHPPTTLYISQLPLAVLPTILPHACAHYSKATWIYHHITVHISYPKYFSHYSTLSYWKISMPVLERKYCFLTLYYVSVRALLTQVADSCSQNKSFPIHTRVPGVYCVLHHINASAYCSALLKRIINRICHLVFFIHICIYKIKYQNM